MTLGPKTTVIDNKEVYAKSEFDQWAFREELEPGETFLLTKYLDPRGRTLEAGSGGGRLLLAMQSAGFTDLHGFDFLPEFVAVAQQRDQRKTIDFRVQDATQLDYPDNSFDQLVYLQQVLCFIATEEGRQRAVREAARILRPGGRMVVSFLSNRARKHSLFHLMFIAWLSVFRFATFSRRSMQYLPWMRHGAHVNWAALWDQAPYTYWYEASEAEALIRAAGLQVVAVGSDHQVAQGGLLRTAAELDGAPFAGRLYLVCHK
jgi:SAM-dependent methyltransferase